jgi:hypothetical protein
VLLIRRFSQKEGIIAYKIHYSAASLCKTVTMTEFADIANYYIRKVPPLKNRSFLDFDGLCPILGLAARAPACDGRALSQTRSACIRDRPRDPRDRHRHGGAASKRGAVVLALTDAAFARLVRGGREVPQRSRRAARAELHRLRAIDCADKTQRESVYHENACKVRFREGQSESTLGLFRDHSSRRGAWGLFRRRDYECDPGVPSVGPVLVGEFPVAFEIEVPLRRGGQGNNETKLRAHTNYARLEAAHPIAGTAAYYGGGL